MAKRHFLQLAHTLDFGKHRVAGALMSEKLDGMRVFWDGGISRGLPISQVPYANVNKKGHLVQEPVATGLWSRYGNVIRAPERFLDQLPPCLLDGELYAGPGLFQYTTSVVKDHVPGPGWNDIRFMVFDSPRPDIIFENGEINETNFKRKLVGCYEWAKKRMISAIPARVYGRFIDMHQWLCENLQETPWLRIHHQRMLSAINAIAIAEIEARLNEVVAANGEGVVVRDPGSIWLPERSHRVLKFKPFNDAEGVVTGYVWGRETALGSKLLGLMGALILDFNGKRLELSGFTDAERRMTFESDGDFEEGYKYPGTEASGAWLNLNFPRGSTVTFRYRELTVDGLPKEARYFRKRGEE
jgi:DNA ligase-1